MLNEVHDLKKEFREKYYSDLESLKSALKQQNIDKWARKVYQDKKRGKAYSLELNEHRRNLLKIVYKLVNKWGEYDLSPEFEEAMVEGFPRSKIVEILQICVPMDRAHALYALHNADTDKYGYHWYSKLHYEKGSKFLMKYGEEKRMKTIQGEIRRFEDEHPEQKPPMNKRLYRLLFSDALGLQAIPDFRRWSQPELAHIVDREDPNDLPDTAELVFLSHTGSDEVTKHFAARMKEEFIREHIAPFFDEYSLAPGTYWRSTIEERVKDCPIFVCFLSPNYFFRHWCMHELDLAIETNKYIIPVHVQCPPPNVDESFRREFEEKHKREQPYHYGEFVQPSQELLNRWAKNISELSESIQAIRNKSDAKEAQNVMKNDLIEAVEGAKKKLKID